MSHRSSWSPWPTAARSPAASSPPAAASASRPWRSSPTPTPTCPYVRDADYAARLPGSTPTETYLRGEQIVRLVRGSGGQAVHPGYGFLSESADFARAVIAGGLVWIGPPPEAIEAMGSKVRAKELMRAAGVPDARGARPAHRGRPPPARQGERGRWRSRDAGRTPSRGPRRRGRRSRGRGAQRVRRRHGLRRALRRVRPPRRGAGPLRHPRHRRRRSATATARCSVATRRCMEEAPAPGLSDEVRAAMHGAAVDAGLRRRLRRRRHRRVPLRRRDRQRFWFLEMNTRLQVEHPVTECVTGLDLVAAPDRRRRGSHAARRAAARRRTGAERPRRRGAALRRGPRGRLAAHRAAGSRASRSRADVDVRPAGPARHPRRRRLRRRGDVVGTHYDAMLAKVISWGPDRPSALRSLRGALRRSRLHGITTNRDLLDAAARTTATPWTRTMTTSTLEHRLARGPLLGRRAERPTPELAPVRRRDRARHPRRRARVVQQGVPVGWRNVVSQPHRTTFEVAGPRRAGRGRVVRRSRRVPQRAERGPAVVLAATPTRVVVERVNGHRIDFDVHIDE